MDNEKLSPEEIIQLTISKHTPELTYDEIKELASDILNNEENFVEIMEDNENVCEN